MPNYFAFLGHQPTISLAELSVSLDDFQLLSIVNKTTALISCAEELDQSDLNLLGGTVIMAKEHQVHQFNPKNPHEMIEILKRIPLLLASELNVRKRGKVTFSLRTHGLDPSLIKALYRSGKLTLKRQNRPCRYVGNERKPAATALLHDANLIGSKDGCEIVIIKGESSLWIGKTIAAQNVAAYARRDMDKPARDTKTGLLPPKLAQVLLNFGRWLIKKNKDPTIYDPFCGTGVIPMEALLRGWNSLASDISQRSVNATERNIEWLRKEEKIFKKDVKSRAWKQDATKPPKLERNESVDVIVTETSLGPPIERNPSQKDAKKWCSENEKLQKDFLINMATNLPGLPIVCVWPVWYTKAGPIMLEHIWKTVEKAEYKPILPDGIPWRDRCTLLYRRPDQFVGREIVLLSPLS